jgi:hypothetical protein
MMWPCATCCPRIARSAPCGCSAERDPGCSTQQEGRRPPGSARGRCRPGPSGPRRPKPAFCEIAPTGCKIQKPTETKPSCDVLPDVSEDPRHTFLVPRCDPPTAPPWSPLPTGLSFGAVGFTRPQRFDARVQPLQRECEYREPRCSDPIGGALSLAGFGINDVS